MTIEPEQEMQDREKIGAAADFISSVLLLCVAAFVLVESLRMPIRGLIITAPGLLPTALGVILLLLSAMLLVSAVKKRGPAFVKVWIAVTLKDVESRRWLAVVLLTGAYILSIGRISFPLATFAYLITIFLYLKIARRYWYAIFIAVAATILTSFITPLVFGISMP